MKLVNFRREVLRHASMLLAGIQSGLRCPLDATSLATLAAGMTDAPWQDPPEAERGADAANSGDAGVTAAQR